MDPVEIARLVTPTLLGSLTGLALVKWWFRRRDAIFWRQQAERWQSLAGQWQDSAGFWRSRYEVLAYGEELVELTPVLPPLPPGGTGKTRVLPRGGSGTAPPAPPEPRTIGFHAIPAGDPKRSAQPRQTRK